MATKSYVGLSAILVTKLTAITGKDDEQLFAGVYNVGETQPTGYPACYILEKTGGGDILDTHRNEREWQFNVIIHQEVGKKTPEEAKTALLDAADRVIDTLDQDPMLLDVNGQAQCKWVKVVPVEFSYDVKDTGYSEAVLLVAIVDIVNRYST